MAGERRIVSGYLGRVVEAAQVRAALATALAVPSADVVADDDDAPAPAAYVEVTYGPGDLPTRFVAFVDPARAPDEDALVVALARTLGASVFYDDGASSDPTRWLRVDADGARYEVFDVGASDELRLDPTRGTRRLDTGDEIQLRTGEMTRIGSQSVGLMRVWDDDYVLPDGSKRRGPTGRLALFPPERFVVVGVGSQVPLDATYVVTRVDEAARLVCLRRAP